MEAREVRRKTRLAKAHMVVEECDSLLLGFPSGIEAIQCPRQTSPTLQCYKMSRSDMPFFLLERGGEDDDEDGHEGWADERTGPSRLAETSTGRNNLLARAEAAPRIWTNVEDLT
jgi:hypothetical protein